MRRAETHLALISSLGLLAVSLTAFSRSVRHEIGERDHWTCQESGYKGALEAAHFSHNKNDPAYNTPENGRMLAPKFHYLDHYNRHGTPGLGLSEAENLWALNEIWKRLTDKERRGLPEPDTVTQPHQMQMFATR